MAKWKLRKATSGRSAAAPEVRILLTLVIDGAPRALKTMSDAERAVLRALRSEAQRAVRGGPFDPRYVLTFTAAELEPWRVERRGFLAAHFAGDRRVVLDA